MNDYHLMNLASTNISERRAEADRHRLARSARTRGSDTRGAGSPEGARRDQRLNLGTLFGRVAFR